MHAPLIELSCKALKKNLAVVHFQGSTVAYAANYQPVRIIDLGLTIYRPLLELKHACSVDCLGAWAVFNAWPRVFALLLYATVLA